VNTFCIELTQAKGHQIPYNDTWNEKAANVY
jgi:hypothetical protein